MWDTFFLFGMHKRASSQQLRRFFKLFNEFFKPFQLFFKAFQRFFKQFKDCYIISKIVDLTDVF
ncbi:hypothetical protein CGZ90_13840 [Fictibacillus aquaticus]|uniref:Uncharacterized protein n=1 Tax=Fictibacillus aquaticus TaxID=2021314 RepID=A0A235F8V2_9BACL|nr:hypothetical protein CGZ90_13840 [Fictibacillus aquaticus]